MPKENKDSKVQQIRTLLMVLGTGVASAIALMLFMIYQYNPSGAYLAKNVLLAPQNLSSMRFIEASPRVGESSRYIFDKIEFSYFDAVSGQSKRMNVDMQKYAEIYTMLSSDKSLVDVNDTVQGWFLEGHPSKIFLNVRGESSGSSQGVSKPFLQMNFVENGDYYRIQLREHGAGEGWAYFYHPEVYQHVLNLLLSTL